MDPQKKPYSAIVAMPYSSGRYRGGAKSKLDPMYALTFESKMSALAAAQAFKEGKADKIILLGEDTLGSPEGLNGHKMLSTADLMNELLKSQKIPVQAMFCYGHLNNTVLQIEKLSELQKPHEKFLIISLSFHTPRVAATAKNQNIAADHESAEQLLAKLGALYQQQIDAWDSSPEMRSAKKTESLARVLNRLDFTGLIQKFLTKLCGPRAPLTHFPFKGPESELI